MSEENTGKELNDEVVDFMENLGDRELGTGEEEKEVNDNPQDDGEITETPEEEEEVVEDDKVEEEEPEEEEEVTEPEEEIVEEEEEEEETVESLRAQNELLLKRIEDGEPEVITEEVNEPVVEEVEETGEPKPINFLKDFSDEEYENLFENKDTFNSILVKVFDEGKKAAGLTASENVLKNLPKLVLDYQQRHVAMTNIVDKFYNDNEDLQKAKKTVAAFTNEIAAEDPKMKVVDVMAEAAVRTRKALGLRKPKAEKVAPAGNPTVPKKVKSGKGTPKGKKLSGMAKEINELIDL